MKHEIASLLALDGRVALVTGAATGLGEGIAHRLADAGARVVIGDIDDEGAERVATAIRDVGGSADALHLDVTDEVSARSAIDRCVELGGAIDIVVNNVGWYRDNGSILEQTYESWRRAVTINFDSAFLCSKPAAQRMVEQGNAGAIVTISSVDGILPCLGTGYDAAKGAIFQFTRSLAVDLAPFGIRVNAVAPGNVPVETRRRMESGENPPLWTDPPLGTGLMGPLSRQRSANIPLGRRGRVDEIANAVLFLCSDAASYMTGQTLVVDGGWTLV